MSSSESISSGEKFDLKHILMNEKDNLCKLKLQIETTNYVDTDGDEFQQNQKNSQWEKDIESYYKQALKEQTSIIAEKIEKLGKFSILQHEWELKNSKLQNTNDNITSELNSYLLKENVLISKLEEYGKILKSTQNELYCTQSKLEGKNCEVEKLYAYMRNSEGEFYKLREQLNEYKKENYRLNEENSMLNKDLECAKTELNSQKMYAANMENNIKNNQESLSNELREKCKKLIDIQTVYEDTKCQLDVEREKVKDLVVTLINGNKSSVNHYSDSCDQMTQFQAEHIEENNICIICYLRRKFKVLQQNNGLQYLEFTDNSTINDKLEQIKLFSEKLCEFKRKCRAIWSAKEIENDFLSNACCNMQTDCDKCCEKTNAIVRNCEGEPDPDKSSDCYTTRLKLLANELEDFRRQANIIYSE